MLAFYRREFAARNWKEEAQGAVVNPNDVTLTFSPPEGGTAVLKLGHKYDLTTVRLVQQLPKAAAKAEPAPNDPADAIMKQAQEMVRAATADALAATKPPKAAPFTNQPVETLRVLPATLRRFRYRRRRKTSTSPVAGWNSVLLRASNRWRNSIAPP